MKKIENIQSFSKINYNLWIFLFFIFGVYYLLSETLIVKNRDYFIINILAFALMIFSFIQIYKYMNIENKFKYIFVILYMISGTILYVSSIFLFIEKYKQSFEKDYKKFKKLKTKI